MSKEDLIPFNTRTKEEHLALSRKGGQSKSLKKQHASRLNGMCNNKNLTPEQRHIYVLLKENRFVELIKELLGENLTDLKTVEQKDRVVQRLQTMLPQKVINLNLNKEVEEIDDLLAIDEHINKILRGKKKKC